jgi:dTDP-4-amino-4,6-dideoxygalactose transaminase
VQLDNRMDFIRYLMRKGCDATIQHYQNAADLECFAEYYRDCPNARRTARQVVLLPTYPGFTDSSIDKIIRATKAYRTGATPSLWSEQGGS